MRKGPLTAIAVAVVAVLVGGGYGLDHLQSKSKQEQRARQLTRGEPSAGREAIQRRACGGCHTIPGVNGAKGKVGPPLTAFAGRGYIGGRIGNTPDNLVGWIMDPHATDPQSAMPPMGIGEAEARDIAAYLYTLR